MSRTRLIETADGTAARSGESTTKTTHEIAMDIAGIEVAIETAVIARVTTVVIAGETVMTNTAAAIVAGDGDQTRTMRGNAAQGAITETTTTIEGDEMAGMHDAVKTETIPTRVGQDLLQTRGGALFATRNTHLDIDAIDATIRKTEIENILAIQRPHAQNGPAPDQGRQTWHLLAMDTTQTGVIKLIVPRAGHLEDPVATVEIPSPLRHKPALLTLSVQMWTQQTKRMTELRD